MEELSDGADMGDDLGLKGVMLTTSKRGRGIALAPSLSSGASCGESGAPDKRDLRSALGVESGVERGVEVIGNLSRGVDDVGVRATLPTVARRCGVSLRKS